MARLRIAGHIGLFIICVYVFCFASPLWGSNWTNWLWALATMIPMFFCHGFLIADDGDDDIEYSWKCIACCFDSLCIASILIKIFAQIPEIHSIILLIVLFFIMEIGLNRMSLSHVFGWASLFMVWPYVNFHSWKEIVGFVVLCLVVLGLVIYSSLYQNNQEEEQDEDTRIRTSIANFVFVTIIVSACLFFINHRDPIIGQLPSIGYLYLAYCILGLIIGFTNNIAALLFSIAAGVCYFIFLSSWSVSLDWSIHGMTSIWEWFSSFFITLWHWVAWGAIHIWDGIVWLFTQIWDGLAWCVVGLGNCIVWLGTNLWSVVSWIGSKVWWLLCWKWFWISLGIILGMVAIIVIVMLLLDSLKSPKIIFRGKFMTCPFCYDTMVEGKLTDKEIRWAVKKGVRTGTKSIIVLTTGGVGYCGAGTMALKLASIGSLLGPWGTGVGFCAGAIIGAVGVYKMNSEINKATDKGLDWVYNKYLGGKVLHFSCILCGGEWEGTEKDGKIIEWHKI